MRIKNREHFPAESSYEGECMDCGSMVLRVRGFFCVWCGSPACYGCSKVGPRGTKIYVCASEKCIERDAKCEEARDESH